MILTAVQILTLMIDAGFPPTVATTMTAIVLRESGGDPSAFNNNPATGDRSYGLTQINMKALGPLALTLFGIKSETDLLDPATNAHAAFKLWAGSNHNLDIAWYINRPGYQQRYESHLPVAQAAALELFPFIFTSKENHT